MGAALMEAERLPGNFPAAASAFMTPEPQQPSTSGSNSALRWLGLSSSRGDASFYAPMHDGGDGVVSEPPQGEVNIYTSPL